VIARVTESLHLGRLDPNEAIAGGLPSDKQSAKAVRRRGTVRRKCLAAALEDPEAQGVWDGTSTCKRQAMQRWVG